MSFSGQCFAESDCYDAFAVVRFWSMLLLASVSNLGTKYCSDFGILSSAHIKSSI